ncbi:MAG: DinB family protein [Chloroflexota bacterium]
MARGDLTVDEIMVILPVTVGRLEELTASLTPARLSLSPEPGAWSINDVLAHLRACHDVLGGNMLRILREDRPTWRAMNPRTWMTQTDYPDWDFASALTAFSRQRAELLTVLEPLDAAAWSRTAGVTGLPGGMVERDVRYYGSWMAAHERAHVKHIARVAAAVAA